MNKQQKIDDLQNRNFSWVLPWEAVKLVASYEDCILTAYKCSANKWTIGWGETNGVRPGMVWTKQQADETFNRELNSFAEQVRAMCSEYPSPNQLGAMTSLAYNIGLGAFKKSTVLRAHNAGDPEASARAFHLWNKVRVNGILTPSRGLTARRASESALYLKPEPSEFVEPSIQAVEAESSLASSPINKASLTTVVAGGLTTATAFADQISPIASQVSTAAQSLGINPLFLLGALLIGAGLTNIYWRYKQRQGGWA